MIANVKSGQDMYDELKEKINPTPVARWIEEAKLLAESHPSKDCQFFAAQAEQMIRQAKADALREAADYFAERRWADVVKTLRNMAAEMEKGK